MFNQPVRMPQLLLSMFLFGIVAVVAANLFAQTDRFSADLRGLTTPATDAFSPTLADTGTEAAGICRAFIAETAGTVKVTTMDGTTLSFTCQAGQQINLRVKLFWSTGTTSTVKCLVRDFRPQDLYRKVMHDAPPILATHGSGTGAAAHDLHFALAA